MRPLLRLPLFRLSFSNRHNSIPGDDLHLSQTMGSDFKEAVELANKEQFESSAVYFSKMRKAMENQEVSPRVMEIVLKKYSVVLKQLERSSELVEVLQQLYFVVESQSKSASTASTPILQNLLRESLLLQPSRALMLSEYLWEALPQKTQLSSFKKSIYPYLGLVYLLNGDMHRAVSLWQDSLALVTNIPMKALLLNNLVIAKYSLLLDRIQTLNASLPSASPSLRLTLLQEREQLQKDYLQGQELWLSGLKSALEHLECLDPARQDDLIEQHQFVQTKLLCHPKEHSLQVEQFNLNDVDLKNPSSVKVVQNIALLLYEQNSLDEANIWLRLAQQESQKHRSLQDTYLSVLHLALVLLEKDSLQLYHSTAESLLLTALNTAPHQYGSVKCLSAYQAFLQQKGRNYEASAYSQQIESLLQKDPSRRPFFAQKWHLPDHLLLPPFLQKY